jgi:hypothetical protein
MPQMCLVTIRLESRPTAKRTFTFHLKGARVVEGASTSLPVDGFRMRR